MIPNELFAFLPEAILVLVAIVIPVVGAFGVSRHVIAWITGIGIALSALFVAATVMPVSGLGNLQFWPLDIFSAEDLKWITDSGNAGKNPGWTIVGNVWNIDPFAALFKWVFLGVAFVVTIASPSYMTGRHNGEYYGLLLLATVGMMVTASSRDLITLFLGLETASFATYALAGWFKRSPDSAEASVKYFIIGSLSSSITLFGIALMYGITGFYGNATVTFDGIAQMATQMTSVLAEQQVRSGALMLTYQTSFVFTYLFLLTGFAFKIASVPFHMWAPDVYEGSPTTVSAFLAAGSKKMGFVGLFKIFLVGLLAAKANWVFIFALIAIVTMTWGNVVALRQTSIKRMLAWSSVAHAGYMLIAIPIATEYAVAGSIFHIMTHAVMKSGAFLVVAGIATVGIGDRLQDWAGLGRRAPVMAVAMAILMISFAGIPPLGGFASKFVLFSASIEAGGWFIALAIAGILNSAISLYYYARIVRAMYVDEGTPVGPYAPSLKIPLGATVTAVLTTTAIIVMGVFPQPFIDYSMAAAASLLG